MPDLQTKRPFVSAAQLEAICARFPTPFYLYSEAEIRRRARAFNAAFAWNPGFREYFAVKATPTPAILKVLGQEGCGCDCATGVELSLAQACGFGGNKVVFSSNDTPAADYRQADAMGALINLDSADMVACLCEALGGRMPERVCLRVNPGQDIPGENGIIGTPRDAKFGMTVPQLLQAARDLRDLGVREFGLHAFLASNTQGEGYYPLLARTLFSLAVRLRDELGVRVTFVDLSGGIGVAYRPEGRPVDIAAIGEGVHTAFDEVLAPAGMTDVRVGSELGRWMLAPAGALVTRVIHEKVTYKDYLGVDACAADLMRPAIYDAYHHITVVGREDEPAAGTYNVVGRLCENNDQFAHDRPLPRVGVGDLLWIYDSGAHGRSMGYNYNGALRPAELMLREDGAVERIRRAETPADYFATLDEDPDPAVAALAQR